MSYTSTLPWLLSSSLQGGRISLPAKELASLKEHIGAAPLVLRLTASEQQGSERHCFVGVEGFQATEGCCELPASLVSSLGLDLQSAGSAVRITLPPPLEAGTALTLRPLTGDFFSEIAEAEAWLTAELPRHYLALGLHDVITLRHCGKPFSLRVTALEPSPAVSLFNTNVALELAGVAEQEEGERGRAVTLALDSPLTVTLPHPGSTLRVQFQGQPGSQAPPTLALTAAAPAQPPQAQQEQQQEEGMDGMHAGGGAAAPHSAPSGAAPLACAYVTHGPKALPTWPSLALHTWAVLSGAQGLPLGPATATAWPSSQQEAAQPSPPQPLDCFSATLVHHGSATAGPLTVTLSLSSSSSSSSASASALPAFHLFPLPPGDGQPGAGAASAAATATGTSSSSTSTSTSTSTRLCPNCSAAVPERTFDLHAATCARQNTVCPQPGCGRVLKRGSAQAAAHAHCPVCSELCHPALLPAHALLRHSAAPLPCPHPGCAFSSPSLPSLHAHAGSAVACPQAPVLCQFCGEWCTGGGGCPRGSLDGFLGLCAHEAACGSRSTQCPQCGLGVVMKLWAQHRAERHGEVAGEGRGVAGRPRGGSVESSGSESMGRVEEGGGHRMEEQWGAGAASSAATAAAAAAAAAARSSSSSSFSSFSSFPYAAGAGAGAQLPPLHAPPPMQLCANNCCSYRAEGAAYGALCSRCSPRLQPLARDKAALAALYRSQLSVGCSAPACGNPCCRLLVGSGEGVEAVLAHLLAISTYYVCVGDHARLAVPPLPVGLARARRASGVGGVGVGAGAGAGRGGGSSAGRRDSKKGVAGAFF